MVAIVVIQLSNPNRQERERTTIPKDTLRASNAYENFSYNNSAQDGHFPATYSFENDTIGSNPDDFVISESPVEEVNVIEGIANHSKVVNVSLISGTEPTCYNSVSFPIFGVIEVWLYLGKITTNTEFIGIRLYGRVPTNYKMRCGVLNDGGTLKWSYFAAGWKFLSISNPSLSQWYHLKIEFECGSGNHYGLTADTFRLTINKIESDIGNFEQGAQDIGRVYLWLDTIYTNPMWGLYDALGYSWDSNYILLDNNINIGNQIYFKSKDQMFGTLLMTISGSLDKYMRVYLLDSNNNSIISFKFHNSSFFYTDSKTWVNNSISYENKEQNIKILFDCSIDVYNIYLNSSLVEGNIAFIQTTTKITGVLFQSENISQVYTIYINDFYFIDITITNPQEINYNEGLDGYYFGSYTFTWEVGKVDNEIDLITFYSPDPETEAVVIDSYTDKNGKTHNQVIKMFDNNTSGEFRHGHISAGQTSGTLEYYLLVNTTNSSSNFWMSFGYIQIFADAGISCNITADRKLWYQNFTGDWNFLQDIEFNKWYHIRWDFDVDDDWYLMYFDDQIYNLTYWQNPTQLNTWGVVSGDPTVNMSYYIDAWGLTNLVNHSFDYQQGDNLKKGLLLSFDEETFMNDSFWYVLNETTQLIYGNHTFKFPAQGYYQIQVFANDTNGNIYCSDVIYFTVLIEELVYPPLPEREVERDLWKPVLPPFLRFFATVYGVLVLVIIIFILISLIIYYKRYYD